LPNSILHAFATASVLATGKILVIGGYTDAITPVARRGSSSRRRFGALRARVHDRCCKYSAGRRIHLGA
jgi:hypothetical protein